MSGKARIEALTNSWYGFAVFSAVFAIVAKGSFGIFSIAWALAGMVFWWIVTFFIGRALIGKSSITRALLLLISALFTLFGTYSAASTAWTFVQTWQFGLLFTIGYSAVSTWMYAKSFRTLTHASVKAYFG